MEVTDTRYYLYFWDIIFIFENKIDRVIFEISKLKLTIKIEAKFLKLCNINKIIKTCSETVTPFSHTCFYYFVRNITYFNDLEDVGPICLLFNYFMFPKIRRIRKMEKTCLIYNFFFLKNIKKTLNLNNKGVFREHIFCVLCF